MRWELSHSRKNEANCDVIVRKGAITPLVALLQDGSGQQEFAACALASLTSIRKENCAIIAREGARAIPPLVTLLREGADGQKEEAARALGSLDIDDDTNSTAIVRNGAVSSLVASMRTGTNPREEWAAFALSQLAGDDEEDHVAIAREGAIPLLVKLERRGTDNQKEYAAFALINLGNNEANTEAITLQRVSKRHSLRHGRFRNP